MKAPSAEEACTAKLVLGERRSGLEPPDTRIMIPRTTPYNPGENALSQGRAAAVLDNDRLDADLEAVIQAWDELPESVKDAISTLVLRSPGEAEWRWSGVSG